MERGSRSSGTVAEMLLTSPMFRKLRQAGAGEEGGGGVGGHNGADEMPSGSESEGGD